MIRPLAVQALDVPDIDGIDLRIPLPAGLRLASGEALPEGHVSARLYGPAEGRLTVVAGGISSGRKAAEWWPGVVDAGGAICPLSRRVLAFDFAPLGDVAVEITTGDQARLVLLALDWLGEDRVAWVGASYGAMVGLALAALAPERLERLCVISGAHRASAQARAWRGIQQRILELGRRAGDPNAGLALARELAMTTYRSAADLEGRADLDGWLVARGAAYPRTMAPGRWRSLARALDSHAVEPEAVAVPTTVIAVDSDQLVPLADMAALAERLPDLTAFHLLSSTYGHDAFLKEAAVLSPLLTSFLDA